MSKAQTLKSVIKKGPGEKPSFGTDPNDPWSTKANIAEDAVLNTFLKSRGLNPEFASKNQKVSHSKSGEFLKWKKDHMYEAVDKEDTITFDIPLLIRMFEFAREDAKTDMDLHKVTEKLISIRSQGTLTMADYEFVTKLKEEFSEQLEEAKEAEYGADYQDMVKRVGEKAKQGPMKTVWVPDTHGTGGRYKVVPKNDKPVKENMDPMAACAQPGDGANSPDDVMPSDKNKKLIQMSKSARIIKDIYKRKGMKEEIYDHEKEDKSVATYGKKPKLQEPKENSTKEDPQAAAIMTGGTTLSGQARDTIEIDPMMKMRRPDQNQQKYKQ